jgi:hypothetical protein
MTQSSKKTLVQLKAEKEVLQWCKINHCLLLATGSTECPFFYSVFLWMALFYPSELVGQGVFGVEDFLLQVVPFWKWLVHASHWNKEQKQLGLQQLEFVEEGKIQIKALTGSKVMELSHAAVEQRFKMVCVSVQQLMRQQLPPIIQHTSKVAHLFLFEESDKPRCDLILPLETLSSDMVDLIMVKSPLSL